MDAPTGSFAPASAPAPPEGRQRWRLTYARDAPPGEPLVGRDYAAAWEAALVASGLPLATTDAGRPRLSLGAALPSAAAGSRELADVWLTERLPRWLVAEALEGVLPPGHRLADLEDVWLGAPPLAGRIAAADYAVELAGNPDPAGVADAARRLVAAPELPRERRKGTGVRRYDLRPLLVAAVLADPGPPVVVRFRTRIHPELGTGRPDEVLATLAEMLGEPLVAAAVTRERLLLADDPLLAVEPASAGRAAAAAVPTADRAP